MEVTRGGNGRSNRASKEEIAERLEAADEDVTDERLREMLRRLADCGQLTQVRRSDAAPIHFVVSGNWSYDVIDSLEASIADVLRDHDDTFTDEEDVKRWLHDRGVGFDARSFGLALGHLALLGRLRTPRADQWERPAKLARRG